MAFNEEMLLSSERIKKDGVVNHWCTMSRIHKRTDKMTWW